DYHDPTAGVGGAPPSRSALTLRLLLAGFGFLLFLVAAIWLAAVDGPLVPVVVFAVLALLAAVDIAIVVRRTAHGGPGYTFAYGSDGIAVACSSGQKLTATVRSVDAMTEHETAISPFTLHVPEDSLITLTERLKQTRWPIEDTGTGWDHGVPVDYAKELVTYWAADFDWREQERRINATPQFTTAIDGHDVHFFHVRSEHEGATPLLLLHGWPGAPTEFLAMVDALVNPVAHGGTGEDAFDVVVPTIPGFGISGPAIGWNTDRAAAALVSLMARLDYQRYIVHGYDTGALIARSMGLIDREHLVGL